MDIVGVVNVYAAIEISFTFSGVTTIDLVRSDPFPIIPRPTHCINSFPELFKDNKQLSVY